MQVDPRFFTALPALLAITAVTLGVVVAAQPSGVGASPAHRTALIAGILIAAALSGIITIRNARWKQKTLRQLVTRLCEIDPGDTSKKNFIRRAPGLAKGSHELETFMVVHDFIDRQQDKLENAEHERRSAEVRLHRLSSEHRRVSQIVSQMSDPILAIDPHGEMVLANTSARRLLRLPQPSSGNAAINQLVKCQDLLNLLTDTSQRKTSGERTGEIEVCDEAGQVRSYRVVCHNLGSRNGDERKHLEARGTFAVFNDISGEKTIRKRNAEFVSAASHEMKTPLSGIKAYVELLLDGEADEAELQEEFLGVISAQADRLQRLVENLLNLARMEAGVVEVNKKSLSLNELLGEANEVVHPRAEQKQLSLRTELSSMYLSVFGDRDMLLQVAINLLSNAIKYTPAGGNICLRSRTSGNNVLFEVEDTGVGLSREDCNRVFERFYRVKKDANMAGGTGLGLALAKHIVEDVHGGQISLDSEEGKGSIFRVVLARTGDVDS